MRSFATIDWMIIGGYLLGALLLGLLMARTAGRSIESYFVADRRLPWWWLGTSMVATTFAADTPLVVTGLIASYGIAGNWFWWSWALAHVAVAVVFASLWRRSGVITDAELVELRYSGRPAEMLRAFKAVFFAILINGIVLGWVIRAMTKISAPFTDWEAWIGAERFASLASIWPTWLIFGTLGETLTVLVLFALVTVYSTAGGIRGVIITDLVQFAIAIGVSATFAWLALDAVGGMDGLRGGLAAQYDDADRLFDFMPGMDAAWLPFQLFAIYLAVQWWAQYYSDGSGYLAQRIFTARSVRHAEGGALWFAVANYALRTWPWVIVGLVALVIYPLGPADPGAGAGAVVVAGDREMAYPMLMADLLPAGALGLLFTGLLAAFMSTVDTHINWGANYLVNDLYRRFVRPAASDAELVRASRFAVAGLAILAILAASRISSIEQAWRFFIALGAGLGLPSMLRWVWWRVNAWTEIAGMTVATVAAFVLYAVFPDVRDEYLLVAIVGLSMTAATIATFVTAPTPREKLERFIDRVRPPGWWGDLGWAGQRRAAGWLVLGWCAGNLAVFGITFGSGWMIFGRAWLGGSVAVLGLVAIPLTLAATERSRRAMEVRDGPSGLVREAAGTGAGSR